MGRPRIDFTDPNTAVAIIIGLSVAFIASQRFAESAWRNAAGVGGPAAGGVIMGKWKGKREGFEEGDEKGFERGYWTPNPAITPEQRSGGLVGRVADTVATGVVAGVTGVVADRAADMAVDQLQGIWPGAEEKPEPPPFGEVPKPPPPVELQQQPDPREVKRNKSDGPRLPDGWRIDSRGRFRDAHDRVASDERRRRTLREK